MVDYPASHSLGFGRCTSNIHKKSMHLLPTWEVYLNLLDRKHDGGNKPSMILSNANFTVKMINNFGRCKCSNSPNHPLNFTNPTRVVHQAPVGEAFPPHSVTFEHRFRGGLGSPNEGMEEFGRRTGGGYSPRKTKMICPPTKRDKHFSRKIRIWTNPNHWIFRGHDVRFRGSTLCSPGWFSGKTKQPSFSNIESWSRRGWCWSGFIEHELYNLLPFTYYIFSVQAGRCWKSGKLDQISVAEVDVEETVKQWSILKQVQHESE